MPPVSSSRALAFALCALAACSKPPAQRAPVETGSLPDIVLVTIDSLRPDHLGCYGYPAPTSYNIDTLAAAGVRCELALSTTSWTLPSHAALFTGLYDSTHGLVTNGLRLSPKLETLAECLKERGYRTAGFFGGPYLHPAYGLAQGFDTWESCMSPATEELVVKGDLGGEAAHEDVTGPRTVKAVERFLEKSDNRPLFLFVHLFDVHYDYNPPREDVLPFDRDYTGDTNFSHLDSNPSIAKDMPARDRQHLVALYDGEIHFTDRNLAQILSNLSAQRTDRGRLLVITGDHGEEFFEHGNKGHQSSLYDELVRIPLIFNWPGHLQKDTLIRDQVRIIDIMPTLLAVAGVEQPPRMQGRNLWPLLTGKPLPEAPALLELLVDQNDVRGVRYPESKIISWRGKYDQTFGFHLVRDRGEGRTFDLSQDWVVKGKQELQRLVDENAALRKELRAEPEPLDLSPELDWRLHQYGYTEGKESKPK
ncbi:MAG: sulfatase-like hydrolase/transferase [Planctomycetes bacterium]|nr:sulfatase-like hydrolase/transferase [Planctomycetota bacterium]